MKEKKLCIDLAGDRDYARNVIILNMSCLEDLMRDPLQRGDMNHWTTLITEVSRKLYVKRLRPWLWLVSKETKN